MTRKNLELTTFEKESKRISETYHVPSYHSDCFVANHGDTDFICDACLHKVKCLLIKEKENKKMIKEFFEEQFRNHNNESGY